ncbi:unnamed protein product [Somion occarium]|uniref:Uncharacterized protein n=1 Tax=Somion occarium TaxID=3059160 RepID=A0ABP1DEG8_9APHY
MYDRSSPASQHSSLHSAHRAKRRHSHRSHSPAPRISTLLPHHGSSQYSPSSRAEDISRLLDPAYSSSSSTAASASRAYVDHRGDLHDPDYRDFPVLRSKTTHKQRRTSASSSRSLSVPRDGYNRYSNSYSMATPTGVRPEWERDWTAEGADAEEDEEPEDDATTFSSHSHFNPFVSESRTRRFAPQYSPPRWFGEPTPLSSSPVSLNDDENEDNALQLVSSPFERPLRETMDDELEDDERKKPRRHHHRIRKPVCKREKEQTMAPADSEKCRNESSLEGRDERIHVEDNDFTFVHAFTS